MAKNSELGYFNLVPNTEGRNAVVLTEDEERILRVKKRQEWKDRQEAWRLAQHARFKAGVLAGEMCSCGVCWPFLTMLGTETQAKAVPGKRCACSICADETEVDPAKQVERCACPACTPWLNSDGRRSDTEVKHALRRLDGVGHVNQMVAGGLEARKSEQAKLMASVLEAGPQAVELLKHVIDEARENPEFLKTGARAAIDVLRLAIPVGWDKETDPDAHVRFLKEMQGTMAEYRGLLLTQMKARAEGMDIVVDVSGAAGKGSAGKESES